jgi:hypothetical protein
LRREQAAIEPIVFPHGGRIWIEGVAGSGTAVVFGLPIPDALPVAQGVTANGPRR